MSTNWQVHPDRSAGRRTAQPSLTSKPLSRRAILRLAGAAAPWLLGSAGGWAAADESPARDVCTLGFSTYGMKSLSTERACRELAQIGYDSVELTVRSGWDADSAALLPARRKALRSLLSQLPLRLTSLMEHVSPTDERQQAVALERLKLAAGAAHDLAPERPPVVQTVLGGGRFEEAKGQLRDRLAEWVRVADEADVTIAIKPHRGGVVSRPSEAVWLFEQLDRPRRLRMVYDYSHYAFRNLPLEETIRTALPHTVHIAVKDAARQGDRVVFQLAGAAGTIDYAELIRRFHAGGYRGDVNCEVSGMIWSRSDYDPIAAAKTCYANLNSAFRQAGVARPA